MTLIFKLSLSPDETRPVEPYEIIVPLMGTQAHLATIKTGQTQISERGGWYAQCTIEKGTAISEEFWKKNGEKIRDYISSRLQGYNNEL